MRLILRNYAKLGQGFKKQKYGFANITQEQATPQHQEVSQQADSSTQTNQLTLEDGQQQTQLNNEPQRQNNGAHYLKSRKRKQGKDIPILEDQWPFASPHIMIPNFNYLQPLNREQVARTQLAKYEEGLGLTMQKHIDSKIFNEVSYYNKVARYHLSEMGPLTDAFLSQGYNFLTRKLLLHLIRNKRVGMLKQLMSRGALEGADYIDEEVIVAVLATSQVDQRNFFMLNILAYKRDLVLGVVSQNLLPSMSQGIKQLIQEDKLISILYHSNGSPQINKLRLLWSLQRSYLPNYNFLQYIVPELKKLRFQMPDAQTQAKANKEVVSLLSYAFESDFFETLFFKILKLTKTYEGFIKGWGIVLLILSKLKTIPGIVKGESQNELHQIFALAQLNFPKNIAREFLRQTMVEFLIYEEHSRIEFENYQRCLGNWTRDYTSPKFTRHHSVLSKALEQQPERLVLTYRQQDNAQLYATTTTHLLKTKIPKAPLVKSQTQVIFCLLKGDYQTVFNDFLVRYSLPSDFDRAAKFHAKLKQIDKDLKFHSQNQAALYKLKVAREFFFLQSFPQPLQQEFLEAFKGNLTVANTLDTQLMRGRQILEEDEFQEMLEHQKIYDEYMLNIDRGFDVDEQGNLPDDQQTFDLSTEKLARQNEQDIEPGHQKGLEVLSILNEDIGILEMKMLPRETAQLLKELLQNKLIDKNFFKSLRTLPLDEAQAKVNELLIKFKDYSLNKIKKQKAHYRQEQQRLLDEIEEEHKSGRKIKKNNAKKAASQILDQDQEDGIDLQVFAALEAPQLIQIEDDVVEEEDSEDKDIFIGQQNDSSENKIQVERFNSQIQQELLIKESDEVKIEKEESKIDKKEDQLKSNQMTLDKILEQTDSDYDLLAATLEAQPQGDINQLFKLEDGSENSTEIDGARDDRAIMFALDYQQYRQKNSKSKKSKRKKQALAQTAEQQQQIVPESQAVEENVQAIEEQALQQDVEEEREQLIEEQAALEGDQELIQGEQQFQKESSSLSESESSSSSQIQIKKSNKKIKRKQHNSTFNQDIKDVFNAYSHIEQIMVTAFPSNNDALENDLLKMAIASIYVRAPLSPNYFKSTTDSHLFQKQLRELSEPQQKQKKPKNRRDWKRTKKNSEHEQTYQLQQQTQEKANPFYNTQSPTPTQPKGFFKKKNTHEFCTVKTIQLNQTNEVEVKQNNGIDLEKISQYRKQQISQDFLTLMQSQTHIPKVGSGTTVAKYLFLQGQRGDKRGKVDAGREMTIQFSSVVGTRTKSYQKYIRNSVFSYELQDSFYQELLEDQLKIYNRNQFKMIVAHLIHYKKTLNDTIVQLICNISEKQHIGYSFVEIAQFIKANSISLSPQALENVCKTWQRFDIINQDLLPFVRDYCKKLNIPFATAYYADLCRSLVKTKRFQKLQDLSNAVLTEIKPKPFKVDSSMVASQVPALEQAWKVKQSESYAKLYLQLLDSIVSNLDLKVPQFLGDLFENYLKLRTNLNERELGCGVVCSCLKKQRFQQLLNYLDKNPDLGTSYMYDRTLQALLSNFDQLEDLAEKILDLSVLKNRVVLSTEQILRSMIVFKKSTTSNAFSKFLEHCLRFQEDIDKLPEVKRQMFFVLNNNVEEVSVAGVFNLLDFIFNQKRDKERKQYRAIKLSEEEKERRLLQIQQAKSVNESQTKNQQKKKKRGEDEDEVDSFITEAKSSKKQVEQKSNKDQEVVGSSKKAQKRAKKQKTQKKQKQVGLAEQLLVDDVVVVTDDSLLIKSSQSDDDILSMVKSQTKKHQSYKRKSIKSFSVLYQGAIESLNIEEAALREKEQKSNMGQDGKSAKGGKTGKGGKQKNKK